MADKGNKRGTLEEHDRFLIRSNCIRCGSKRTFSDDFSNRNYLVGGFRVMTIFYLYTTSNEFDKYQTIYLTCNLDYYY